MSTRSLVAGIRWHPRLPVAVVLVLSLGLPAAAAQLTIGAGSQLDLGTAAVDLGCASLAVAGSLSLNGAVVDRADDVVIPPGGTFHGGAGALFVTGDWIDAGVFDAGTSVVSLVDGCGNTAATVTGSSTFHDLVVLSATGKTVLFEAGQRTTVTGSLTLAGAPTDPLVIRSTAAGVAAELYVDPATPQSVTYVDVDDNHASGFPVLYGPDSVAGSNAIAWILDVASVPVAGAIGTTALVGALVALGTRRLARRRAVAAPAHRGDTALRRPAPLACGSGPRSPACPPAPAASTISSKARSTS